VDVSPGCADLPDPAHQCGEIHRDPVLTNPILLGQLTNDFRLRVPAGEQCPHFCGYLVQFQESIMLDVEENTSIFRR
jgi:hypothetical protein